MGSICKLSTSIGSFLALPFLANTALVICSPPTFLVSDNPVAFFFQLTLQNHTLTLLQLMFVCLFVLYYYLSPSSIPFSFVTQTNVFERLSIYSILLIYRS